MLSGLIMVISTSNEIAVTLYLVLKSYYLSLSYSSRMARLSRLQGKSNVYPSDTSRQRRLKTMEVIDRQTGHQIALIRAIMVISTRANSAVKMHLIIKACCLYKLHILVRLGSLG